MLQHLNFYSLPSAVLVGIALEQARLASGPFASLTEPAGIVVQKLRQLTQPANVR